MNIIFSTDALSHIHLRIAFAGVLPPGKLNNLNNFGAEKSGSPFSWIICQVRFPAVLFVPYHRLDLDLRDLFLEFPDMLKCEEDFFRDLSLFLDGRF